MDQIVDIVRAIGEPTRLRILMLLTHGEMAAGEMSIVLNQSQPRVSRHLKLLVEAGLIERRPEGAWVFFKLMADGPPARIVAAILAETARSDFVIARDGERLAQVQAQREHQAQAYFESAASEWETLRRLHQPDDGVEAMLGALVGDRRFQFHVDLGSGTGRMLELFAPQTQSGEGIDSSRKMLAMARARVDAATGHTISVRHGDILSLPYGERCADLITIHQVLHYMREPHLAIGEAARVLADDGILLIADFAPHSFEELREKHAHRRLGLPDQDVVKWCELAGLSVVTIEHVLPPSHVTGLAVTIWKAMRQRANLGQQCGRSSKIEVSGMTDIRVSFEFFPPKSETMEIKLWDTMRETGALGA
ncbi:MAG: metalloregulator ArsR/SmtB family transcription factor, partial [Hyphomonadaceae bacterium]|nr:metalloregulator ArsR/SmtB family transcription factor [Hyphomonadaceae bacterium]